MGAFRSGFRLDLVALAVLIFASCAFASDGEPRNMVTFINSSGHDALIVLMGPTRGDLSVADRSSGTLHVKPGSYRFMVRYGGEKPFRYGEGESFEVIETASKYSWSRITLHTVADGNYAVGHAIEQEFEAALRDSKTEDANAKQHSE